MPRHNLGEPSALDRGVPRGVLRWINVMTGLSWIPWVSGARRLRG